jgi:hypothetical protein
MKLINVVNVRLGHRQGCEWVFERYEVSKLGKFIDHYKYAIELTRLRKALDKVQRNHFPCSFRYR